MTFLKNSKEMNWESVNWSEISIGDIVKLEKQQICPADILILDSEHNFYVNTLNVDGSSFFSKKSPLFSTNGKKP